MSKISSSQTAMTERLRGLAAKARSDLKGLARAGPLALILNLTPVPASRPRVTKWGSYYGKNYERFRKAAQEAFEQALQSVPTFEPIPRHVPVAVTLEFVCERPKAGKLLVPVGDADNYAKGPLDSMTSLGRFWADDVQVAALTVLKRYAAAGEDPHINVAWSLIEEPPYEK